MADIRLEASDFDPSDHFQRYTLAVSPDADARLDEMAHEIGGTKEDVLRKAIGMFRAALRARRDGKVVGSADSSDVLDTEFVGY